MVIIMLVLLVFVNAVDVTVEGKMEMFRSGIIERNEEISLVNIHIYAS